MRDHHFIKSTLFQIIAIVWLLALTPAAFAADPVVVVPTGAATHAPIFDLDTSADPAQVREQGQRRLVTSSIESVAFRDLKILPDGSNLLADVGARGVAITDSDGALTYTLASAGDRPRITSASVLAYAAPGEPTRILLTDSNRSQVMVVEPGADTPHWTTSLSLPSARAEFAQAIALGGNRAAVAVNWPVLQMSGIVLYEVQAGQPQREIRRLVSFDHGPAESELVVVPELEGIRDIMGLPNGNLLVTTRYSLLELGAEGSVIWEVDIGDSDALRGEFASARLVESGDVAVATFEPGVWTNPHTNHRVHWLSRSDLEGGALEPLATSPALSFAPMRVEPADGHGGSGTFGYRPGLDAGGGALDSLAMIRDLELNNDAFRLDQTIRASASIENTGADELWLTRLAIVLVPGACGTDGGLPITLFEANAVELGPGETYEIFGQRRVDEAFTLGRWCASLRAETAAGESARLGPPVEFEILNPAAPSESIIEVDDLDFSTADSTDPDPDPDSDAESGPGDEGCGCTSMPAGPPAGLLLFMAGGLLLRRRWG